MDRPLIIGLSTRPLCAMKALKESHARTTRPKDNLEVAQSPALPGSKTNQPNRKPDEEQIDITDL